jgi:hypothetical protein
LHVDMNTKICAMGHCAYSYWTQHRITRAF